MTLEATGLSAESIEGHFAKYKFHLVIEISICLLRSYILHS